MKFGEKVRDLRKKHSLTQDELAQCLGINKRTIIGWERDGRYPRSVEMLEKMADFDKPLILINRQLDKQTKQMVCGYALGHYLEHQLLMDLHTLNKFLTIKDKHILLYEHNAFTSHLIQEIRSMF